MKKSPGVFAAGLVLIPATVFAVTWQMDSSPFSFAGVASVKEEMRGSSPPPLTCSPGISKGTMTFRFALPSATGSARLTVYSLSGTAVRHFDLRRGTASLTWSFADDKDGAGVYVASLRCGAVERKIRISILK